LSNNPESAAAPASSPWRARARALAGWACFAALAAVSCALGARLDDWFFEGVPILGNPTYEAMFVVDENGLRRGKPGARWKKVALNNLGMRGADVASKSAPGCSRWMFLGASETFGEPSTAGAEYPARIRELARQRSRCVDVLNTAYPGIGPQVLQRYYTGALQQYSPDIVFIYPSTHFYLGEELPRSTVVQNATPVAAPATEPLSLALLLQKSRFFERLIDSAEVPAPIQEMRLRRWIDDASRGKPKDWYFTDVPPERVELLAADLRELIAAIRASGAEPVLLTHAVRVTDPPRAEDHEDLYSMRRYMPRASERILAAFEYRAAERVRQLGMEQRVKVIDVARVMDGRRDRFVDLVHFNRDGHNDVAQLVVNAMGDERKANALQ
jgi:hypothetical protein